MSVEPPVHRALAVDANNTTWEILGKRWSEISLDEAEEMTRRAYAAAYHWARADGATPAHSARAEWLLARVWAVRANGPLARHHALRCLGICESAGLFDFDRAYAHEALARALACMGEAGQARDQLDLARAVSIADPEDRSLVEADRAAEPWFGLHG